jgi:hypothetical protein
MLGKASEPKTCKILIFSPRTSTCSYGGKQRSSRVSIHVADCTKLLAIRVPVKVTKHSQLFDLYSGSQTSTAISPWLATAAGILLNRRMQHISGDIGWLGAWAMACYTRLFKATEHRIA